MTHPLRPFKIMATEFGIGPLHWWRTLAGMPWYFIQWRRFRRLESMSAQPLPRGPMHPCLHDRLDGAGSNTGHYFHQDLYVARCIFADKPARHIDVGSRVDGFVAHVASFMDVEVLDVRDLSSATSGLAFRRLDIMGPIPQEFSRCTSSLSCLHALEHFGLGRYGNPLDPEGHRKGLNGLAGILKPGGRLYLSVPIGPTRIEFNAHRVFSVPDLLAMCRLEFSVVSFSYVDDAGAFHENANLSDEAAASSFGCRWGCGIVTLLRKD